MDKPDTSWTPKYNPPYLDKSNPFYNELNKSKMNREIKFRGQRKSDSVWLYGSLINNMFGYKDSGIMECVITDTQEYGYDCYQDLDNCDIEVIPETVGQFTGLKDKNGTDIFEGDICRHYIDFMGDGNIKFDKNRLVTFDKGSFGFDSSSISLYPATGHYIEVIGNVHENPNLLCS